MLRLILPLAALLVLGGLPARADEKAKKGADKPAAKPTPDRYAQGRGYFASAVRWIRGHGPKVDRIDRAFLRFADVQFNDPDRKGTHNEAFLELWFEGKDRIRREARQTPKDASPEIKVLDGGKAWIKPRTKTTFARQHGQGGKGGGADVIKQLREDAGELTKLARFLTPTSLDGKGVTWHFDGMQSLPPPLAKKGAPAFARVSRKAPGETEMLFFFSTTRAAPGVPAGHLPYCVYVEGSAAKKQRAEYYVLDRWRRAPGARAEPGRIQGFTGSKLQTLERFVLLFPEMIAINGTLHPDTFKGKAITRPPLRARK